MRFYHIHITVHDRVIEIEVYYKIFCKQNYSHTNANEVVKDMFFQKCNDLWYFGIKTISVNVDKFILQ